MSKIFGKADILGVKDREPVAVPVPEWATDGDADIPVVLVRKLGGEERKPFNEALNAAKGDAAIELTAFVNLVCDESGSRLFDDADAPEVAKKFGAAIARVARRGLFVNGYGRAAIEAHEKN